MSLKESILNHLEANSIASSKDINYGIGEQYSYATVKRALTSLITENFVAKTGIGKATKYSLTRYYKISYPLDLENYFVKEQDDRILSNDPDFSKLCGILLKEEIFSTQEKKFLNSLHLKFKENISRLSKTIYDKEMERLAIDLSWKSSQIEGNTYSLLETERLLKEKVTAAGKPKDDAIMLLNHKDAINFIVANPNYITPVKISSIEDIHSLLTKELDIDRNIRKSKVGISGTNYTPLDNEFQIREALQDLCDLLNAKENVFEKSFLSLVLLSYIQAFADGNKRTGRIISNAFLLAFGYCPISYRTVDSIAYKKAMLMFYERNNLQAMKQIFIDQYAFAVNTYF